VKPCPHVHAMFHFKSVTSKIIMKNIILLALTFFGFVSVSSAQIGFVDSKYILNKMPEYKDSLNKLNYQSAIWQKEVDDKQAVLDKMYVDFERDEPMLTDEFKKKRTDQIFYYEKDVRELQRARFGFQGDLYKKRLELIKPLEDRINAAIQSTAIRLKYATILDKSEGITVLYTKSDLDITNEVMKEMGMIQ
jgi:outer membrane protein